MPHPDYEAFETSHNGRFAVRHFHRNAKGKAVDSYTYGIHFATLADAEAWIDQRAGAIASAIAADTMPTQEALRYARRLIEMRCECTDTASPEGHEARRALNAIEAIID